jgi:ABC-type dipeptide/oligopeptide/nickel transport system permease subunit
MFKNINWSKYGLVIFTLPLISLIVLSASLANFVAPYDPYALDVMVMLEGPTKEHWIGTDELGRDVLSRIIYGAQISLKVGIVAVVIGGTGGTFIGIVAAYFGGFIDNILMRLMEIVFCFPAILLAVILMANFGTSIFNAMLAIGIIFIPGFARLTRAIAQTVQRQAFLEAAICLGVPGYRIVLREIFPNVAGPVLVEATVAFSYAVLLESALSFLGLGSQPPEASWGNMINTGRGFIDQAPWISLAPGAALFATVFTFNLLGDGLRDILDPKLNE